MAHKYFADQYEDEEVLMVFNKHPIVMRRGLIYGMVAIALGTIPSFIVPTYQMLGLGLVGGFLLGGIVFSPSWIAWKFSVFIVTDQRLIQITQKGMFKRSVIDLALNQIQMVNYEVSGVQETLLGYGTIMIQTFVGDLTIHDVHHPAKTQKELLHILRERGITTAANNPKQQAIQEDTEDDEDEE